MRRNTSHGAATTPASSARSLIAIALLYNIARLALAAALTGLILLVAYLIDVDVPFFVTVVLAVILSSPVSMIALKPPLRTRINYRAEAMDSRRATKKGLARPDAT